jgi:uncharacterized protein (TIGR00730 family)
MSAKTVTVFGSHKTAADSAEYAEAVRTGRVLAEAGFTVCNGGYAGIMEASARGAKEAGGKTLGITTRQFPGRVNGWIDAERCMDTWDERLTELVRAGDAYVFFDGGTGTLTELFVVWEKTNKKIMERPILILGPFLRRLASGLRSEGHVVWNDHLRLVERPADLAAHFGALRC